MTLGILLALLLVAANGFFVATEFAITRVRPTQVKELEAQGKPGAASLRHAVDHLDAYLAACQLGITISSIGLGVVGKPAFEALLEPVAEPLGDLTGVAAYGLAFAFAFGIVTLLHVVLGELAPKSLAIARNTKTALAVAAPMRLFYLSTKPFVDLFNWMGNMLLKPFGIPRASEVGHAPHSEDELRLLLQQSLEEGLIDPDELEYADRIFSFGDLRVRQVMLPRPAIKFVTTEQSVAEAATVAAETGHTRLPLCEPDVGLDAALGVVNSKDLLAVLLAGKEVELRELARPLKRVAESILIDELLIELRRERQHIALVVDEHGTTIGLITLEDVLEEIVGDIEDEFDPHAASVIVHEEDGIRMKGEAPLHVVSEQLGIEFEDPDEATIGGHVIEALGRLPAAGETIELDGHRVEVLAVNETRVLELVFRTPGSESESQ
ncbi:MAG TPA: hemolysin family protein [Gaiellaceae bacterium]